MGRLTLEEIKKKGRLDEYEYFDVFVKKKQTCIKIKCKKCGNEFEQIAGDHLNKKTGCRRCFYRERRLTLEDVKVRGRQNEYDYLDIFMKNNQTFIKIKCKKCENEFEQTSNNHLIKKSGCPKCCEMKREKLCRNLLEQITSSILKREIKFHKVKPNWLINPETNYSLELDGYNEELKLAFEHNGCQHYEFNPYFHRTLKEFTNQRYKDVIKYQTLLQHNIKVLIIPYTIKENELETFITDFIYTNYNVFYFVDTNEYKLYPAVL